jgi:hypothetical protein
MKTALEQGIADAWKDFEALQKRVDAGEVSSGDMFGTRAYLKNNYLYRFAAAKIGIWGNSKAEAAYPIYRVDSAGQLLDASKHRYTLTLGKIREIAVLKLIGTRNRTIAAMILQQAVALGVIGFVVGKITATLLMAPIFPKYVLLEPLDSVRGFIAVVLICILSSVIAIRAALKVDPAAAIG